VILVVGLKSLEQICSNESLVAYIAGHFSFKMTEISLIVFLFCIIKLIHEVIYY
jgi:hypothetical protein